MERASAYAQMAKQVIQGNSYMVVCTSGSEGMPWGAPVFFANDPKFTKLYFISAVDSLHAKNILANPDVSLVIFDSSSPVGTSEGVQIEGSASVVGKEDITEAVKLYSARLSSKTSTLEKYDPSQYLEPSEFRFFKVKLKKIYVTGEDRRTEADMGN